MRIRIASLLAIGLAITPFVRADEPFFGPGSYPQFRDLSILPGGGLPIDAKGNISILGALSLSTPVAYSLRRDSYAVGGASRSQTNRFAWINTTVRTGSDPFGSDGTGGFLYGWHLPYVNVTAGYMVLSSEFDTVLNLHVQYEKPVGGITYAVGATNVGNRGGQFSGDKLEENERGTFSPYIVGTYEFAPTSFVTVGLGRERFEGLFGNASYQLTPFAKAFAEYDTFGVNAGVTFQIGTGRAVYGERKIGKYFLTLSSVQLKRATWALMFGF